MQRSVLAWFIDASSLLQTVQWMLQDQPHEYISHFFPPSRDAPRKAVCPHEEQGVQGRGPGGTAAAPSYIQQEVRPCTGLNWQLPQSTSRAPHLNPHLLHLHKAPHSVPKQGWWYQFSAHKGLSLNLDKKSAGEYITVTRSTCHREKHWSYSGR